MGALPYCILVVDDESSVRTSMRGFLEDGGYEVAEATDGQQAIEHLRRVGADLALLDLRMPQMSGLETLRHIRADWPDMPVVVVSGAGTMQDVVQALRLGAWDYLTKPIEDLNILGHAVARVLERSQLIEEKKRYQQHLEEEVEKRTAQLKKANAAKDEFLAMVSHELRTPLTPVMLLLDIIKGDPRIPRDCQADLAMAARHVALETRLIDDLLDLTRIMCRKLELCRRDCDVHAAIRAAAAVCQPLFDDKHIDLQVRPGASRSHVVGDSPRLQQVFFKLLNNAAKFTGAGGAVMVTTWNETTEEGGRLVVEVRDTGIGMRCDVLGRIFNVFEQADQSRTRKYGGLGIGLAISKAVVELHGGVIEAASDGPGRGSVFRVCLPLAAVGSPDAKALSMDRL